VSGPAPGTGCHTCEHPDVGAINALINEGVLTSRQISRRYGLAKDTVARHAFKKHPGVVPPDGAPSPPDPDDPGTTKTRLQRLQEQRGALEVEMQRNPRSDISRELRQVNAEVAEIEGTDRPRAATVADVHGLPEQVRRWFEALEPFPDAREAMFLATDRALLEAAGVEA
jgi:hypothetical protein